MYNSENPLIKTMFNMVRHYNHDKYWKMRAEVVNKNSKLPKLVRLFYLYLIKKMDAFNNASTGTFLGYGASFATPPLLNHGLNGIIIASDVIIGENCIIFHQVTISQGYNNVPTTIGDNCVIGAGAKILGSVTIGKNVRIGTNAVVVKDVPDNCTVVGIPAKIVKKDGISVSNN